MREVLVERARARASWSSAPTSTSATAAAATCALLERMGAELGFEVLGLGLVAARGRRRAASRTRRRAIRELLAEGDVAGAAALLGRPHEVRGTGRATATSAGRELGFPTANVAVPERICLPADGVYAGTFVGRRRRRAAGRDLARPPPDVLRGRRDCRCSRRTCSTSTATSTASRPRSRFLAPAPGRGAVRRASTTSSRRCTRDVDETRRLPRLTGAGAGGAAARRRHRPSGSLFRPYPYRRRFCARMPDKTATITEHRLHETDTGSAEVQVALLTGAHQPPHRAPEGPQEGPSHAAWSAHARRSPASAARLPPAQRRRAVPSAHRQARPSPVAEHARASGRPLLVCIRSTRERRRLSVASARRARQCAAGR